jgi:hypothetical protein
MDGHECNHPLKKDPPTTKTEGEEKKREGERGFPTTCPKRN